MYVSINRLLLFLFFLFFVGCAPKYSQYISQYRTTASSVAPDYSNLYYWAAHPWKKDPSDSVPAPLRSSYSIDSSADVFFIYPTTLTDSNDSSWNADINDPAINAKTDYSPVLYQASVFNHYRIFSPRYRQAHIRAYFTSDTAKAKAAFDLAYQDIKTAFRYYIDHYNNGRPIIIASHSQGSTHAQRLLKDFFENTPLQKQLVVAYVLGMYIPNNEFSSLKMCKDSLQTGCICGWRTFKRNYEPDFVVKENGTGLVTNPLSWTTSTDYADNTLNKGSILLKFNKPKEHVTDAQIHDGILWIGKLHLTGGFLIRKKNFHIGDINLFYYNIRNDVQRRVNEFHPQTP
ncbi:MAG TPA: DUF3089 domain-containing protein [Chitinophagaceae bacterium]|jgi:Protein of unknown function (DUF3089)|nr:DUF3089 domain-containing protein [Chitinophagaceae bacterium]